MKKKNKAILTYDAMFRVREQIYRCDDAYYGDGKDVPLSDAEYDKLRIRLHDYLDAHPELKTERDLRPGYSSKSSAREKVSYEIPMLSLHKSKNIEEIVDFCKCFEKAYKELGLGDEEVKFIAEHKIDGMAFSALYKNGLYIQGSSRGDGQVGENITSNIAQIIGLPRNLHKTVKEGTKIPERIEIRGEAYISKEDFKALQEENDNKYSSARNLVAGTLMCKDPLIVRNRKVRYFAYEIGIISASHQPPTQIETLNLLKNLGFVIDEGYKLFNSHTQVESIIKDMQFRGKGYKIE